MYRKVRRTSGNTWHILFWTKKPLMFPCNIIKFIACPIYFRVSLLLLASYHLYETRIAVGLRKSYFVMSVLDVVMEVALSTKFQNYLFLNFVRASTKTFRPLTDSYVEGLTPDALRI